MSDAQRLKQLEDENRRLKHMVADQALDIQVLKAALGKSDDLRQAQRGELRRGRADDEPAPRVWAPRHQGVQLFDPPRKRE